MLSDINEKEKKDKDIKIFIINNKDIKTFFFFVERLSRNEAKPETGISIPFPPLCITIPTHNQAWQVL